MTHFSKRLEGAMSARAISKKELSELAEVSPSSLASYLKGERTPSVPVLVRLSQALSTTTDYLLGLSEVRDIAKECPQYQYIEEHLRKLDPFRFQIATGVMRAAFEYLIDD